MNELGIAIGSLRLRKACRFIVVGGVSFVTLICSSSFPCCSSLIDYVSIELVSTGRMGGGVDDNV